VRGKLLRCLMQPGGAELTELVQTGCWSAHTAVQLQAVQPNQMGSFKQP
jgi:hypothetical protein